MIPRVINYCWFGKQPLPKSVKECIKTWKKFCPDYQIKEWNETNFDVSCNQFVQSAYKEQNWAFVSDYARLKILYEYGGLYLDTDVEMLQPLEPIVKMGPYMGFEFGFDHLVDVNPGQGCACEPNMDFIKELLETYSDESKFSNKDSIVKRTTTVLANAGLKLTNKFQQINGVNIYPTDYFGPMNYYTGQVRVTSNTVSFHHYSATWTTGLQKLILKIERCNHDKASWQFKLRRLVSLPLRVINKLYKLFWR